MKKYASKSLADVAEAAGSMLLFTMFAGCMLIIIAAAVSTYTRIKSSYEQSFGTSASLKYVTNKLRSAQNTEILGEGEGFAAADGGIICVIYNGEDGIYEKNISADDTPELSGGICIFSGAELSVSDDGELYTVTVLNESGSSRVVVRKG